MNIIIRELRLPVSLGVHAWEQNTPREVSLSLTLDFDGSIAAATDTLRDTIDYTAVEEFLRQLLASRHWNLLETLVEAALDGLLLQFPLIDRAELEIAKPGALRFAPAVVMRSERIR